MQNLTILNKKQAKEILNMIKKQWNGCVKQDFVWLKSDKSKLYLVDKDVFDIDFSRLRVNSLGLYFGEIKSELRLSIEGSQLVNAKKNVLEVDEKGLKKWLKGEDIDCSDELSGFVIVKHKEDCFGCGKYKEGRIFNYVPKVRRIG